MSMFTWKCHRVEGALERYVRGELSTADSQRVAAHLSGCPSCQTRQEALFVVRCALDAYPRVTPSLNFDSVIMNRMDASHSFQSVPTVGFFQHVRSLVPLIPRPPKRRVTSALVGLAVGMATLFYLLWPSLHPANSPRTVYSSTAGHHRQAPTLLDKIPPEILHPDWLQKNAGRYDYQPLPPAPAKDDDR